ncbi:MAG: hypothetical protein HC902_10635 [Calothrix sp. SM1_5_4]|nr:hypothetical protein [Calothrix sp. SM1_5_4]
MELRRRTEEDCERILAEAQQTARELKENRLLEAEDLIRKREQELISHAKSALDDRMARFEEDMQKESERQREALKTELDESARRLSGTIRVRSPRRASFGLSPSS